MQPPKYIEDLLQSDLRKQIFEVLLSRSDGFSINELCGDIEMKGIKASHNMVQQFLQALLMRGFLRIDSAAETRRGRTKMKFEVVRPAKE